MIENFQRGGVYDATKTTKDYCASQMGGFCDRDREEAIATAYESANGIPVRRTWESEAEFEKRVKGITNRPVPQRYKVVADPAILEKDLKRMLRNGTRYLTVDQKKDIHELENALGLPLTEFTESYEKPSQDEELLTNLYQTFEIERRPPMRMKALNEIGTDPNEEIVKRPYLLREFLQLVVKGDPNENVRKVAQRRLDAIATPVE